uniref:Calponin-homology (CH) domain-containing protein n=1 Tax=Denticeps clupeoides TaxID=299321 RepID=A0AAY4DDX6_9TELE
EGGTMEANKAALCDSLVVWLQTFSTPAPCKTLDDLTTGVAMSQALHQIDPSWFSDSWLSRIKDIKGDNWRLKMNNLKKILQMMVDYYSEMLDQQITGFPLPDLVAVAERSDPEQLGRLLQLLLGCAVKCERKQEYIQVIMTLEESVQHVVMTAIQELMNKESMLQFGAEAAGDTEQQMKKTLEDLSVLMAEKEELAQRCQELDAQVTILQEERNSLLAENDVLTDRASQLDSFNDPSTPSGKKHSQLQLQVEQLQEENFRLEAAKDDYRIHCEELEKQLIEIQHRNDELTSLAEESRALKDELDILRNCSDRAVKLEASVETYRKKLEGLSDLRRQVKVLEEKNMSYMQNTVSLEEELRKANAARAQLETYKRQVLAPPPHAAAPLEHIRTNHNIYLSLNEISRIILERDSLKETIEELRCTQAQQDQLLQAACFPVSREKFIRLQHENKMLRLQQEDSEGERITELQTQLEEARRGSSQLETEKRLNRERIHELQQQVEDLQKALQGQGDKAEDVSFSMFTIFTKMSNTSRMSELISFPSVLILEELRVALKKKDDDMRAMEDRYKMYLEKARNVIRALDPKLNPASAEIQSLKNQLSEKDKRIIALERECEQAKLREYEEKLIVTAWYNKVRILSFQKMAIESRLGGRTNSLVPSGQSFLAQQRQVTNARRAMSINVPATSSK